MTSTTPRRRFSPLDIGLIVAFVLVSVLFIATFAGLRPFAALFGAAWRAEPDLPARPLTEASSAEELLSLLRYSHLTWETLEAEATTTLFALDGERTEFTARLFIHQPDEAALITEQALGSTITWSSDGEAILHERDDPPVHALEVLPPSEQRILRRYTVTADSVNAPHPLGLRIPSRAAALIFSTGVAQSLSSRINDVVILGSESIAGRDTLIISAPGQEASIQLPPTLYWVDTRTGIILRTQACRSQLDPDDSQRCEVERQIEITRLRLDAPLPVDLFNLQPQQIDSTTLSLEDFQARVTP
ncbi:MAG: hypothetical protein GYB68_19200 [Chloroflexi bacterium]|nr:hypothetical protein [Chloroflexota bacterium]